ncbi:MAG: helix-turn-helix domain-containing protein [Gammaproteobacteria bacterium]
MIRKVTKRGRRPKQPKNPLAESDCELPPLRECVRRSVRAYFKTLNGHGTDEFYELVLSEVEQPLLEVVLTELKGNLSRASEVLGLTRVTLRKKLRKYGLERSGDSAG